MDRVAPDLEGDEVGAVVEPLVANCRDDEHAATRPAGAAAQAAGPAVEPLPVRYITFSRPPGSWSGARCGWLGRVLPCVPAAANGRRADLSR